MHEILNKKHPNFLAKLKKLIWLFQKTSGMEDLAVSITRSVIKCSLPGDLKV